MLNFRCVGKRFCVSGGWQNLPNDVQFLLDNNVFAVLDLQFTPEDSSLVTAAVTESLEKNAIIYNCIRMLDSEFNPNLQGIIDQAFELISGWEEVLDDLEAEEAKIVQPKMLVGLGNSSPKILIKCGAGNSRSVFVLIAYLCMSRRWTYEFAKNWVQESEDDYLGISHAESHYFGMGIGMDPFFTYTLRKMFPEPDSAFGEKE